MPNRIIKESILTSDTLAALSWFEQGLFFRLLVLCDDYGRADARPAVIRGTAYSLYNVTNKQIADALSSLATAGIVDLYEVDGRPYLQLKTWAKHQRIRAKMSKYPAPENGEPADIRCHLTADDSKCQPNPIQSNPNQSNPIQEKDIPIGISKKKFGEFGNVALTDAEHEKLRELMGDRLAGEYIERLSGYLAQKGKRYKSHYATIRNWWRKDGSPRGGRVVVMSAGRDDIDWDDPTLTAKEIF